MIGTLIVLAKAPVPGRVKTRLGPRFGPQQAAMIAAAALRDTLAAVAATPASRRILAFDGDPTGWVPAGWGLVAQPPGGQAERMIHAFDRAGAGSALLVAMDTPQVEPRHLQAFDPSSFDACLGPAPDGGYWVIGFRDARSARAALTGIPMSTDVTCLHQRERLAQLGLNTQILDDLTDVDTAEDATAVAAQAPATNFARAVGMAVAAGAAC